MSKLVILLCLLSSSVHAFFSINYFANGDEHPALMTSAGVFKQAPSADQVADIYARLSRLNPIMWEGAITSIGLIYIFKYCNY